MAPILTLAFLATTILSVQRVAERHVDRDDQERHLTISTLILQIVAAAERAMGRA